MDPQRTDATRHAAPAQTPRLLGVPVPLRAFGFAPGWQLPARGWAGIDLREDDGTAGAEGPRGADPEVEAVVQIMTKGMAAVQPLLRTGGKAPAPEVAAA